VSTIVQIAVITGTLSPPLAARPVATAAGGGGVIVLFALARHGRREAWK
jgi:hypothetical protein